ncbi:MAG: hypothetical protein WCP39_01795 [Chlamydiota bacterium]
MSNDLMLEKILEEVQSLSKEIATLKGILLERGLWESKLLVDIHRKMLNTESSVLEKN